MTAGNPGQSAVHPFEAAGLGKAPFRVVGVERRVGPIPLPDGSFAGAPGQPMGCCQFCFTGIAECWLIQSADGRQSVVGCDCVRKTGDVVLRKEMAPLQRTLRHAREDARIDAARRLLGLASVRDALAEEPHPLAYRAARGETALGFAEWSMESCGTAGRLRAARVIERAAKACGAKEGGAP